MADSYAVIVENDITAWADETGVRYHFPRRYQSHVQPGTRLVHYKGKMIDRSFLENRLSPEPHYFAVSVAGPHSPDPESEKGDLFLDILDYQPFIAAVPHRIDGETLEDIPPSRVKNFWRDGVRPAGRAFFEQIVALAEMSVGPMPMINPGQSKPTTISSGPGRSNKASSALNSSDADIAAMRMADQVMSTVSGSNGQEATRIIKNKENHFPNKHELEKYIRELLDKQDGCCALSGLPLAYREPCDDKEMLASLDRIDSNGHYSEGNLQVVCRFLNRWKSDTENAEFRRLLAIVQASKPMIEQNDQPAVITLPTASAAASNESSKR